MTRSDLNKIKKFQIFFGDVPILTIDDEDIYNFKKFLYKMCLELSKSETVRNTVDEFKKYAPVVAMFLRQLEEKEKRLKE